MFTWICPTCGREVPPSQDSCPNCFVPVQSTLPPVAAAPIPRPPQPQPPPPPIAPPPRQTFQPPPPPPPVYAQARPKQALPGWLVSILVAGGLMGAGYGAFSYFTDRSPSAETSPASIAEPPAAASKGSFAKHLEISGLRVSEGAARQLKVNYVVTNHSNAEMPELQLTISLRAAGKEGGPPICVFKTKAPSLGPLESKDLSAVAPTALRAYELPDWQFLRAAFEITGPR